MKPWKIDRRETTALSKFDGSVSAFKTWRDRMLQHMARCNTNWVSTLRSISKRTEPIDINAVRAEMIHGVPAEDIGIELYGFITDWVNDNVFKDRRKYSPEHHGFEPWRRFHQQFEGNGRLVDDTEIWTSRH